MPINSNRYVDIVSSLGGASDVPPKELILRIITTTPIHSDEPLEFQKTELDQIGDIFDSKSDEYKMASFYFSFISKQGTTPKKIQYQYWHKDGTKAQIFGGKFKYVDASVSEFVKKFPSKYKIKITYAGTAYESGEMDFTGKTKLNELAKVIEDAVKTTLNTATVKYDPVTLSFKLNTEKDDNGSISVESDTIDFLSAIGFTREVGAQFISGSKGETVTEMLDRTTSVSNNYGSLVFAVDFKGDTKSLEYAANWVSGRDVEFMLFVEATPDNVDDLATKLSKYASTGITINKTTGEYPHILPAAILASQDFTLVNTSANYMFQKSSLLTPSVINDKEADKYDGLKVNYYGRTQENGSNLDFYQRGVLQGGSNSPQAMGVHANEQWLKGYLKSQFLNMFLALQEVPANDTGEMIAMSYINQAIIMGVANGTIISGKSLTTTQINYISEITGDNTAFNTVIKKGYWYSVTVGVDNQNGVMTNVLKYLLVYSKSDAISKIEGRHILI